MIEAGAKMCLWSFADVPTSRRCNSTAPAISIGHRVGRRESADDRSLRFPPFSGEVPHDAVIGKVVF